MNRPLTDHQARHYGRFLALGEIPPAPGLLAPGHRLGKYIIQGILGRGGMGIVYRASDESLGRDVALKVLLPGGPLSAPAVERFSREARAAARLRHPHIVQVHDVGEAEGLRFLALELIEGTSLDDLPVPGEIGELRTRVGMLEKIARALHHAHLQGVIHRDVKPANILVDRAGEPRVADFGLARLLDDDQVLTRSRAALGTPMYMSPEQVRGDLKAIDARSDVYALGILLYEALAGRPPFPGRTTQEVYDRILHEDPASPRAERDWIPASLEAVCQRAMSREPAGRYSTAGDFAAELARFLEGKSVEARTASISRRMARTIRRRPWIGAGAAAVLLAAVGIPWGIAVHRKSTAADEARQRTTRALEASVLKARLYAAEYAKATDAWTRYRAAADEPEASMTRVTDLLTAATAAARLALEAGRDEAPAHALLGDCLSAADDRAAEAAWEKALALDPGCFRALAGRAQARLEYYFSIVGPTYVAGAATAALRIPEEAEALKSGWRRDLEAARQSPEADHLRLQLLESLEALAGGKTAEASSRIDAYLKVVRGDAPALYIAGQIRLWLDDLPGALVRLDAALRFRRRGRWLQARGLVLWRMARPEEALAEFEAAIRLEPAWDTILNKGAVLSALGRQEEAVKELDRAIAMKPGQVAAHANRGSALRQLGRFEEAIRDFAEAARLEPDDPAGVVGLGNTYLGMNRLDDALREYNRGVEKGSPVAYLGRGHVHWKRGRTQEAAADFDSAIRLDPKCRDAYVARGRLGVALAERHPENGAKKIFLRKALDDFEKAAGYPGVAERAADTRQKLEALD